MPGVVFVVCVPTAKFEKAQIAGYIYFFSPYYSYSCFQKKKAYLNFKFYNLKFENFLNLFRIIWMNVASDILNPTISCVKICHTIEK
jgi:hypothetical protein